MNGTGRAGDVSTVTCIVAWAQGDLLFCVMHQRIGVDGFYGLVFVHISSCATRPSQCTHIFTYLPRSMFVGPVELEPAPS